jgi:GNAT superfamily N-acetyltransferase
MNVKPVIFDPQTAGDADWQALNVFDNVFRAETWPDDPSKPLEETIQDRRSVPSFVNVVQWVVWSDNHDEIWASANIGTLETEHNRHLAEYWIGVVPTMRRRGIARQLLKDIARVAGERNRRLMIASTGSVVPAGKTFMERLGAKPGLESRVNQLNIADLDRDLMRDWQERAKERAIGYELGMWIGPYREAELEAIKTMMEVMNTAPKDDLDVEDFTWTVEQVRQMEESLAGRKVERWTVYARHVESGELAGYTDVYWNPNHPEMLGQGDTGVVPQHRNKGLGRWLKAAMIEKVLQDRSQVAHVRTGNANSNVPMLRINHEMGFKPYRSWTVWQVELEKIDAYLANDG